MTVAELIHQLLSLPPDATVYVSYTYEEDELEVVTEVNTYSMDDPVFVTIK